MEFDSLTREFDDLNKTNEHEIRTKGSKLGPAELHSRQEVMTTLLGEYQAMFKRIKGFSHETSDDATQAGAGLKVLVKEELMKGTFAGAGIKTQREALTGEHMQKLDLIRRENIEQDAILDEMAKELDELKDIALRIQDVSGGHGRGGHGGHGGGCAVASWSLPIPLSRVSPSVLPRSCF